jgi:hypothetical protein
MTDQELFDNAKQWKDMSETDRDRVRSWLCDPGADVMFKWLCGRHLNLTLEYPVRAIRIRGDTFESGVIAGRHKQSWADAVWFHDEMKKSRKGRGEDDGSEED